MEILIIIITFNNGDKYIGILLMVYEMENVFFILINVK